MRVLFRESKEDGKIDEREGIRSRWIEKKVSEIRPRKTLIHKL